MLVRFTAAVLALIFVAGFAHAETNWPQFRGPRGDGSSIAKGLPVTWSEQEHVRWKTPIHGRGWSSPVVWEQQIWLTTASEDGKQMFAVCVDAASGKIVHDLLLFENEKPDEIHLLNSYASPTPAVEAGRVYLHFGSYGTACLDTANGRVVWQRRDLPCKHWRGPGSSPFLYGERLIIHYDGYDYQYVVALDKTTGRTIWKTDRQVDFGTTDGDIMKAFSTPILIEAAGRKQLISSCSKAVLAYDPDSGREIWRVRYDGFSATARPLFGNGLVFVNTGFSKADMLAIRPDGQGDVTDTHVAWRVTKAVGSKPSAVLVDGLLLMVHDNGVATCLEAATGKELWNKRIGENFSASLLAGDGKVYFFSHEGTTTVVRPDRKYQELAVNKLDDGFMASPAVTQGSLILRTRSHLYRVEP
jgi:outer membrane protein assembly factor BamB